jgi:hypothetical protein
MKDGHPGEQEDRRVEHIIPAEAVNQGIYEVVIEVTANGMFGLGPYRYQTPDVRPSSTLPFSSDLLFSSPRLLSSPRFFLLLGLPRLAVTLTTSLTVISP